MTCFIIDRPRRVTKHWEGGDAGLRVPSENPLNSVDSLSQSQLSDYRGCDQVQIIVFLLSQNSKINSQYRY